jgi:hypothetical protein
LKKRGWDVDEFDNWRDAGWFFHCKKAGTDLEVSYAQTNPESNWFLQVAPTSTPLSKDIHSSLASTKLFSKFQWRWDGPPDEANHTKEPHAP